MTVGAVKPLKKAFCCGLPGWKNEVRLIVPRTSPQRPQFTLIIKAYGF
jgi:hypothetical protein